MSVVEDLMSRISTNSFGADAQDNQQRAISTRQGDHWMDGQACLANLDRVYTRPWDGCIEIAQLSKDNLPPFYVRLRDDQAMLLWEWARKRVNGFSKYKLNHFWPHDFSVTGELLASRPKWISSEASTAQRPEYRDLGLFRTFYSSGKFMAASFGQIFDLPSNKIKDDSRAEAMPSKDRADINPETQAMEEELKAVKSELEKLSDQLGIANTRLRQKEAEIQHIWERDDLEQIPSPPQKKPKYLHYPDPHPTNEPATPTGLSRSNSSRVSELRSEQAQQQQQQLRDFYADYTDLHAQWQAYDHDRTESLLAAHEREGRNAWLRETRLCNKLREIKEFVREVATDKLD